MLSSEADALLEGTPDERFGGVPPALLVRNVILHPGAVVDLELLRLYEGITYLEVKSKV